MSTGSPAPPSLHQRFLIMILALENNTQSFPHLFSPTNVQGEKKTKYRALGNTNIHREVHGRKRKKQRLYHTLHLSSLGQTNTQYIIRSPPLPKVTFRCPKLTLNSPHLFLKDSQHLCPILRS